MEFLEKITELKLNYEVLEDNLITFIAIASALIFVIFIVDVSTSVIRNLGRAKKILKRDAPKLNEIQEQLGILSTHAGLYANSLGAEGAKLLQELNTIVNQQSELLEFLEVCIDHHYVDELKSYFIEQDKKDMDYSDWSTNATQIIELLGKRLYDVSERSAQLGLPKAYRRESTVESLVRANIVKPEQ